MMPTMEMQSSRQHRSSLEGKASNGTWIEVLPHLDPKFGGISAVIPQLVSQLAGSENYAVQLAAFCPAEEGAAPPGCDEVFTSHWPSGRLTWARDRALRRRLSETFRRADGVHIHGLWDVSTDVAARMARASGTPYVLSAHGMLEPWALRSKGWKKKLYSVLRERANVEGAACLHALTHAEAEDYRRFGSRRPIAVIPNGVQVPAAADAELVFRAFPALRGKRILLYLGRIHPKKGLHLLMSAWSALHRRFADVSLVVAGPDDGHTQGALATGLQEHGCDSSVIFTGMLQAEMKWSALSAAHCFVLPSYSEGLSVAALEALGMGVPVVLTRHCHMPEVAEWGAGYVIEADTAALYGALEAMLSHESPAHAEMSRCGKQLVRERFSWRVVAKQMAELYAWVQGGPKPGSVALLEVAA